MRIHWLQVVAFLQVGSGTNRDRHLSGHMNRIFSQLVRKVGCKRSRSPDFHVLAPSLRCPDSPGRNIFFMSFLRMSWQNLNDSVFYFWEQVFSWCHDLIVHQNVTRKKKLSIKQFLPFTSECDRLTGCRRGSLWEWQLSNNSILNTSLFYGLCLETTSLHCRFY